MQPFVIHAHFYQPERTNPWTGVLDPEPTAAPARDWNDRIHVECYRPNGTARIFDERRRVERIVNNYEHLSFNFGPTLLSWMERRAPETYARIVDGDWRSVGVTGHGNALAQAYNHMILPLANDRDRRTQILWGLADFRHRFGREAAGMWLPETAADPATIDALIDARVQFTVLEPHQAHRVRHRDGGWHVVGGGIDTGRPYRHRHSDGSGRSIALFFYDGSLAQGLAFGHGGIDAGALIDKLKGATPPGGGLVHAALDGETFGHHRRFGELGLAYTLFEGARREGLIPTSYAAHLADHPPTDEVEIVAEGSAWSCAHGLGRWSRDCGCSTDGREGWNQAWREPLRRALDVLRDAAGAMFEERGSLLLRDPWMARDDYIAVRLGTMTQTAFLDRHARRSVADQQPTEIWTLLESQRHAMVMYTSCGWFFSDVSGLETVYVLRSAARVLELLEELGAGRGVRRELLEVLGEARSNKPEAGTGVDVWRAHVEPAVVTRSRIAAHIALLALSHPDAALDFPVGSTVALAGHTVTIQEGRVEGRGSVSMTTGRVRVASVDTGRVEDLAVAALHLGGLDFHGVCATGLDDARFTDVTADLWHAFPTEPMARLLRRIWRLEEDVESFVEFGLEAALPGGRQAIVGTVFGDLTERFREQYSRLYHDHRRALETITEAGYALPPDLRAAAELTHNSELARQLATAVGELAHGEIDVTAFGTIRDTARSAREQGLALDLTAVSAALLDAVTEAAGVAARSLRMTDAEKVDRWLGLVEELGLTMDLGRAQEVVWDAAARAKAGRLGPGEGEVVAHLGTRLGLAPVAWSRPD